MEYNFNVNKIVLATLVPAKTGEAVHKSRPEHGLVFFVDGEKNYYFEDTVISTHANDILYLPKGSDYVVESVDHGDCYAINFHIDEPISFKPFVFKTKNKNAFFESFKKAREVWKSKAFGYEMKCKSELYDIIYHMQKEYELGYVSKSTAAVIRKAVDYIHTNYTEENISISHLARMCKVSETYFRVIFNKLYGTSPIKYINNLKIEHAKELIESGMYSIGEVCALSGYNDESYFSREFKKATGVCPSEY